LPVRLDHLGQPRRVADKEIVGQRHGERRAAGKFAAEPDGIHEAQRRRLLDELDAHREARRSGVGGESLANGVLAGGGDDEELAGPRGRALAGHPFDEGDAGDRQELLGGAAGQRAHAGPSASARDERVTNRGARRGAHTDVTTDTRPTQRAGTTCLARTRSS
jgi:hypothetical protein